MADRIINFGITQEVGPGSTYTEQLVKLGEYLGTLNLNNLRETKLIRILFQDVINDDKERVQRMVRDYIISIYPEKYLQTMDLEFVRGVIMRSASELTPGPGQELCDIAKKLQADNPKMKFDEAFTKAGEDNPALLKKYNDALYPKLRELKKL